VSLRYYRPDHVNNYEVGWKLSALNHRLQFNVAAYIIRWTNVQMSVFDQNISNQTFTNNLLNARIHGIEGDLAWRATRELTVNSSFSYNDSKVTDYVLPISALVPLGSPLAMSPKFQFSVTGRYQRELANGFKPFIQVSVRHVSSSISSDVANTSIRWTGSTVTYNGVTVNNGDPISPQITSLRQGGYEMLDISLGVSRDKWTLEVYGKNLTNARRAVPLADRGRIPHDDRTPADGGPARFVQLLKPARGGAMRGRPADQVSFFGWPAENQALIREPPVANSESEGRALRRPASGKMLPR
jgi:outer membrane receptor protein involved in Fe transport